MCGQCSVHARTIQDWPKALYNLPGFRAEFASGRHKGARASRERETACVRFPNETTTRPSECRRRVPANSRAQSKDSPGRPAPTGEVALRRLCSCIRRPQPWPQPRLVTYRASQMTRAPGFQQISKRALQFLASSDRFHAAGRKNLPRASPERTPLHREPATAVYIARKTNKPVDRAAKSAGGQSPRAGTACGRHRNPSSTLPPLRSRQKRSAPKSPELPSSQKLSRRRDNSFLPAGVYLRERLCRFTLGSFGSPIFRWADAHSAPPRTSQHNMGSYLKNDSLPASNELSCTESNGGNINS